MLIAYSMIVQEKKKVNYQQSDLCQLVDWKYKIMEVITKIFYYISLY